MKCDGTRRWLAVALAALVGCVNAPSCPDAPLDGGTGPDVIVVLDAGTDVGARDAGGADCALITPVRLNLDRVWLAVSPEITRDCLFGAPVPVDVRVRVFRRGESVPVFDSLPIGPLRCLDGLGSFERGEYDVAIESFTEPQWIAGAALTRLESCTGTGALPPYCRPVRVTLDQCGEQGFFAVLHCDPHAGACPDVMWPWTADP